MSLLGTDRIRKPEVMKESVCHTCVDFAETIDLKRTDRRRMTELKGRDGSAEELDRETVEEQTTVGKTRRKDGG